MNVHLYLGTVHYIHLASDYTGEASVIAALYIKVLETKAGSASSLETRLLKLSFSSQRASGMFGFCQPEYIWVRDSSFLPPFRLSSFIKCINRKGICPSGIGIQWITRCTVSDFFWNQPLSEMTSENIFNKIETAVVCVNGTPAICQQVFVSSPLVVTVIKILVSLPELVWLFKQHHSTLFFKWQQNASEDLADFSWFLYVAVEDWIFTFLSNMLLFYQL